MGRVVLVVVVTALRVMILKAIDTTNNRFEIKEDGAACNHRSR